MAYTAKRPPARQNWELYRGDTWIKALSFKDSAGDPIDISLDDFSMRIEDAATAEEITTLTVGDGITKTATNTIVWQVSGAEVSAWPINKRLKYDLEWTNAGSGIVKTVLAGTITVTDDITP